jgi:hypothetical protein
MERLRFHPDKSPNIITPKKATVIAAFVSGSILAVLNGCGGNTKSDRAGIQSGEPHDAASDTGTDAAVDATTDVSEPDTSEPDASVPDATVEDAEPDSDAPPQIEYGTLSVQNYSEPIFYEFDANTWDARIAYFTLTPDRVEDIDVSQINISFEGDCVPDELPGFGLSMANDDAEIMGDFFINEETGKLEMHFDPVYFARNDPKSFYIYTHVGCCNGDFRTYIADESDIVAAGRTYGMPVSIDINYDGNTSTINGYFGVYKIPNDTQADIGSTDVNCLGIRTRNCLSEGITIQAFTSTLEIANPTDFDDPQDLIDTSVSPAEANFTDIKLLTGNTSLGEGMIVMGPVEISTTNSDVSQTFTLNDAFTIFNNEERDYRLSIDIRNNQAIIGNQLECILEIPNRYNFTYDSTGEPIEEGKLYIEPIGFRGMTLTITGEKDGCMEVQFSAGSSAGTPCPGDTDVPFGCYELTNGCGSDATLASLRLNENDLGFRSYYGEILELYNGGVPISSAAFDTSFGFVSFNNIDLPVPDGQTTSVCVFGGIDINAFPGNQIGLDIISPQDIVFQSTPEIGGDFPIEGGTISIADCEP